HVRQAILGEEHVLGAAEADAGRAEFASFARVGRLIRVGAHAKAAVAIGDFHETAEVAGQRRILELGYAEVDDSARAVDRDLVAPAHRLAASHELLAGGVDLQVARPHDAHAPHAARHDRRVRGHAAGRGHDALRRRHAVDVVGHGLVADEDHALALLATL